MNMDRFKDILLGDFNGCELYYDSVDGFSVVEDGERREVIMYDTCLLFEQVFRHYNGSDINIIAKDRWGENWTIDRCGAGDFEDREYIDLRCRYVCSWLYRIKTMTEPIDVLDEYVMNGYKYLDADQLTYVFLGDRENLMNEEALERYNDLPNMVEIYRGCDYNEIEENDGPVGVSWSLSYDTAEWFAKRWNPEVACVVKAIVPKEDIMCLILCRSEEEVLMEMVDDFEVVWKKDRESYRDVA